MFRDHRWLSWVVGGAIIAGVAADRAMLHVPVKDAEAYHQRVAAAAKEVPIHMGNWLGRETEIPPAAQALLRPNVTMSRQYKEARTGKSASFLLVQCRDARDLEGHFPPNCYPAHGYVMQKAEPTDWPLGETMLHGTMYEFSSTSALGRQQMKIFDVMLMPDGQSAPDMRTVNKAAGDRRQRYFGAGQIQILTDAEMSEEDRTIVISTILSGAKPVIDAIRAGVIQ